MGSAPPPIRVDLRHTAVRPPSAASVAPVMKLASSAARKTIAEPLYSAAQDCVSDSRAASEGPRLRCGPKLAGMSTDSPSSRLARLREPSLPVRLAIGWLTNAILLWVVVALLHHASTKNIGDLLVAAIVYGVLNTFLKPVLRFITLPLAILSFGIVWFFVSMLMLLLTKDLVHGFSIHGFWTYVAAALIIWVVNMALDLTPGPWQLTGKRRRRQVKHERLRRRFG